MSRYHISVDDAEVSLSSNFKVHIVNTEEIVDAPKGVAELDGICNVLFHCLDHEIVLEGMSEEITQQRCTVGAHWNTNNLPENRASKTNYYYTLHLPNL